jgi:fucokinase
MLGIDPIDIVVTAAREAQARGYRAFLADREQAGELPAGARWMVVTDPDGRRAGSGAATALALEAVVSSASSRTSASGNRRSSIGSVLRGRRVIIIHSGGDSRRLPAFAAVGKAFAPLPTTRPAGGPATVFDLVLADLLGLPSSADGDVFVASGDAVVGAGSERIDCAGDGVVGIAQAGSIERATRHGVYVARADGTVTNFLQKPSPAIARAADAVRRDRSVLIDTGIVRFSPRGAEALLRGFGVKPSPGGGRTARGLLARVASGRARPIDLYDHVLTALVPGLSEAEFRKRLGIRDGDDDRRAIGELRTALRDVEFAVRLSNTSGFLHLGTTREYIDLLTRDVQTSLRYDLVPPSRAARIRSIGSHGGTCTAPGGALALVVGCLGARLRLAGENLVVGLPPVTPPLALPRGFGCVAIPVGTNEWATVVFHVDDDAKTLLSADPRWAGASVGLLERRAGFPFTASAPPERATLWDARLWRITARPEVEPWMVGVGQPSASQRRASRLSMAELLDRVDHARIVKLERQIRSDDFAHVCGVDAADVDSPRARQAGDVLRADDRLGATAFIRCLARPQRVRVAAALVADAKGRSPLLRARALATAGRIVGGRAEQGLRAEALAAVGEAVSDVLPLPRDQRSAVIRPDETVWASAPARIDLAGGWSDTPPICFERGGTVVNLAVDLDNRPPVNAIAKLFDASVAPAITIHSVDLGEHRTIRTTEELFNHRDPRDWTALVKAALRIAGIAPPSPKVELRRWLERFGGGLSLSILAAVPKGSGLGTSSILGATVLACLDRVVGRQFSSATLVARTSLLEQMIATRGGWQDQIGGLEPGLKIARSEPGLVQRPTVERVPLSPDFKRDLAERAVLCFTGQRRMARNILERVVERYLVRDIGVLDIVAKLKDGAERMRTAALEDNLDAFAREVSRYWALKVELDPLALTPEIAAMAEAFRKDTLAWTLPGAGGGGFLFFIARDRRGAERIRRGFRVQPQHRLARPVEWSFARHGLRLGSV